MEKDQEGLSLVQSTLNQASIKPEKRQNIRDEEVGGIPVDSDYIIFIVDTSGSMISHVGGYDARLSLSLIHI